MVRPESLAEALEELRKGCTELTLLGACSGAPSTLQHRRVCACGGAHARGRGERLRQALGRRAARRTHRAFAPRAAGSCGIGDEGVKELAAALKTNTMLTKLDLCGACSGAPPTPRHRRTRALGACGAPPRAFDARARRAHRARARVPQTVGSATRGPRSWPPRSRPTRPSPS